MTSKQKYILAVAFMLIATAAMVFLVLQIGQNSSSTQKGQIENQQKVSSDPNDVTLEQVDYPPNTPPTELELSENDQIRFGYLSRLGLDILALSGSLGLENPTSVADFAEFQNLANQPWIDPATGELYEFVFSDPEQGEVQFVPGGTCSDDYRSVIPNRGDPQSFYAAALLLDDGSLMCNSNV